jgi:hypothetical protein
MMLVASISGGVAAANTGSRHQRTAAVADQLGRQALRQLLTASFGPWRASTSPEPRPRPGLQRWHARSPRPILLGPACACWAGISAARPPAGLDLLVERLLERLGQVNLANAEVSRILPLGALGLSTWLISFTISARLLDVTCSSHISRDHRHLRAGVLAHHAISTTLMSAPPQSW